jgi:HK97 family phage portal protein
MGLFDRFFGARTKSDTTSSAPAQWLIDWVRGGGDHSLAGVSVTPDTAMHLSAVFTCVRNRSEDVGKLPCLLYKRLKDGGKQRATDHPAYALMRSRPNPYQTAFEFKQLLQAWIDLRGNGYALKEYDSRGRIVALWPLNPTWVMVYRVPGTWELFYRITIPNMVSEMVPAEAVLHIRGMSLDGYCGLSPIAYHRQTIGLGIAAEKYGAAFFGNSAQPSGGLKIPTVLDKTAAAALRADWEAKYKGVDNAKKLAIFDGGMEWVQTGMDNTDAQYLETRKFQNSQIYGIYRMPPHKAGELERSTNNNIEHQGLEYVTDCLMTEFVRWEQCLARDLLTEDEQVEYFFEFMPDAILRGDIKTRYEAYAIARNWGWLNVDDIRDRENMNPLPDGKGKIYLQPLNMSEAGAPPPPAATGTAPNLSPAGAKILIADLTAFVARSEAESAFRLNGHGLNGHGHNGA